MPKPITVDELNKVLQTMWDDLPQNSINKAILSFVKDFELVWNLGPNTFNTSSNKLFSQGFELLASCDSLKCLISMFSFDFNNSTMMNIVIFIVIVLHGSEVWVDKLYTVRFSNVSGLSSLKNFKNQTTVCGDIAYCLVGYFILSHPVYTYRYSYSTQEYNYYEKS